MGLTAYFYLKERPRDASWLTDAQKQEIESDLSPCEPTASPALQPVHASLWTAFWDVRFLSLVAIAIAGAVGTSSIGLWLPSIIRETGIHDILFIGALSAIPNGAAIFAQYFNARHSDRTGERRWHAAGPLLAAAAGWCVMPFISSEPWLSILVITFIACATFSFTGPFWSMPTKLLSGTAAAGGLGVITSMIGLGSFLSPVIMGWLIDRTHTMAAGEIYLAFVLFLGGAALVLGIKPYKVPV